MHLWPDSYKGGVIFIWFFYSWKVRCNKSFICCPQLPIASFDSICPQVCHVYQRVIRHVACKGKGTGRYCKWLVFQGNKFIHGLWLGKIEKWRLVCVVHSDNQSGWISGDCKSLDIWWDSTRFPSAAALVVARLRKRCGRITWWNMLRFCAVCEICSSRICEVDWQAASEWI